MFSRSWQTRFCSFFFILHPVSGWMLLVGWLVGWLIDRCYSMVVFSNNNYDFLLRDGLPHKCLGKANRPTVFADKDRIPSNAKKVLIYTEGLNGVGSCRKSSLAESRSWDVTSTFQHPNVSDQVQERHRSLLGIDWKGQLALLAFAPTSVSAWLTARSMSDVGWWFHQILPSVSVCVSFCIGVCVFCLLVSTFSF